MDRFFSVEVQSRSRTKESFRFLVRELFEFIIATGSARMDVYKK